MDAMTATEILLGLLDEAFDKKAWHGTNLRGSLRGLDARTAAWRPAPRRHNIWEIALHAAYWKYAVRRRLTGEKRGSFPVPGSDWFGRPGPGGATTAAWRADVGLLLSEHRKLRAAVAAIGVASLPRAAAGGRTTNLVLIRGAAAHDLYHAGQIQLLKRLRRGAVA
jgi:DinB superfamily